MGFDGHGTIMFIRFEKATFQTLIFIFASMKSCPIFNEELELMVYFLIPIIMPNSGIFGGRFKAYNGRFKAYNGRIAIQVWIDHDGFLAKILS